MHAQLTSPQDLLYWEIRADRCLESNKLVIDWDGQGQCVENWYCVLLEFIQTAGCGTVEYWLGLVGESNAHDIHTHHTQTVDSLS